MYRRRRCQVYFLPQNYTSSTSFGKTAIVITASFPAAQLPIELTPQRTLLQYIFNLCLGSRINGHFKSCFHKVSDHRFSHNADTDKSDFFSCVCSFPPFLLSSYQTMYRIQAAFVHIYWGGSQGHSPTYEQAHVGLDLLTLISY